MKVGNPPVFDGKLNDVLFAFVVDGIRPKASSVDERKLPADVAFVQKELTLSDGLVSEELGTAEKLFVVEVDSLFYVFAE